MTAARHIAVMLPESIPSAPWCHRIGTPSRAWVRRHSLHHGWGRRAFAERPQRGSVVAFGFACIPAIHLDVADAVSVLGSEFAQFVGAEAVDLVDGVVFVAGLDR